MKDQHDLFWNAVVAAEAPSAEEMAQAEAGLREIEATGPVPEALSQAQIDAMIAAAVRPVVVTAGAPRRTALRRLVAIAAVLFLSLSVAAGVLLWQGTHAVRTLDYVTAIEVATEPKWADEHKLAALTIIDEICGSYAFPALNKLCAEEVPPPLRDQARWIRDELIALLTQDTAPAPEATDLRMAHVTENALNASLPIEQRQQALAHLGHLSVQGMRAFARAELSTATGREQRRLLRKRLLSDLTQ